VSLGDKQELFTRCLVQLLLRMHLEGYQVRMGQVERSPEEAARLGKPNSVHTLRLAADLHLFQDRHYLTETKDHETFGVFWERLHPDCRWGGRFGDGNHYSITHDGVK